MSLRQSLFWRGLGGKRVFVPLANEKHACVKTACRWGGTIRVSTRLGVTLLYLVSGTTCGEITSVMLLRHAVLRGLGGECV